MGLLLVHTHTKTPCLRVRTLIADIVQVLFPGGSWLLCKWVVWDRQVLWLRLPASLVWVSVSSLFYCEGQSCVPCCSGSEQGFES